jgi:ubiquitin-protein ligase
MSSISLHRIQKDLLKFRRDKTLRDIFYHPYEDNIYRGRALIIGPEDTPYENGYYFFEIEFPKTYPQDPPKLAYSTLDSSCRFNPNLYKCGKVCLSLINTWQGDQWTPCQSLTSVLLSIQSMVLVKHPIQNEPGWEKEVGKKSKDYNKLIKYHNLRIAILKMLNDPPYGFDIFREQMIDYFMENRFKLMKYITSIECDDKKIFRAQIYSMAFKFNVDGLKKGMEVIYDKFIDEYKKKCELMIENPEHLEIKPEPKLEPEILEQKKVINKSKRKAPNNPAKNYDIGHELLSENDNKIYIVKLIKNDVRRWVLKK